MHLHLHLLMYLQMHIREHTHVANYLHMSRYININKHVHNVEIDVLANPHVPTHVQMYSHSHGQKEAQVMIIAQIA